MLDFVWGTKCVISRGRFTTKPSNVFNFTADNGLLGFIVAF